MKLNPDGLSDAEIEEALFLARLNQTRYGVNQFNSDCEQWARTRLITRNQLNRLRASKNYLPSVGHRPGPLWKQQLNGARSRRGPKITLPTPDTQPPK